MQSQTFGYHIILKKTIPGNQGALIFVHQFLDYYNECLWAVNGFNNHACFQFERNKIKCQKLDKLKYITDMTDKHIATIL